MKHAIHQGHHNCYTTLNHNTTNKHISTLKYAIPEKRGKSTLHGYLKKESLSFWNFPNMAVCLHFQPERKLNWKTLREKRQRLEDLSVLEYIVLKLASPSPVRFSNWYVFGCKLGASTPFKKNKKRLDFGRLWRTQFLPNFHFLPLILKKSTFLL